MNENNKGADVSPGGSGAASPISAPLVAPNDAATVSELLPTDAALMKGAGNSDGLSRNDAGDEVKGLSTNDS